MSRRVEVVGSGMVGARLCDEVRRRDPDGRRVRLTVLGAEPRPAYNRVLLPTVRAGGPAARSTTLHTGGWAARRRIDLRTGVAAVAVDRTARAVRTADGAEESYDEPVLATGSRVWLPVAQGIDTDGVTAFRDLADCARILDLARPGTRFAVPGGGLLEAPCGPAGRGARVTLLHRGSHLMERQIEPAVEHVLAGWSERVGVEVRVGVTPDAREPGAGIRSSDGLVAAAALVVATGVRAETGPAAAAGPAVDGGTVLDDRLATSDGRVHAIVDCARPAGCVVQPGWEQAAVLADLLTGADPAARHRGTRTGTRTGTRPGARDVDLATVSDPALLDAPDVVRLLGSVGGCAAAPAFVDERVVAGAMVGLPDAAASMIQFCDGAIPVVSDDRLALLLGRALPGSAETADPGRSQDAAVVCRCNIVTRGVLVAAWRDGATDPGALARVTTGWGSCGDPVRGISAWLAEPDPSTEEAA